MFLRLAIQKRPIRFYDRLVATIPPQNKYQISEHDKALRVTEYQAFQLSTTKYLQSTPRRTVPNLFIPSSSVRVSRLITLRWTVPNLFIPSSSVRVSRLINALPSLSGSSNCTHKSSEAYLTIARTRESHLFRLICQVTALATDHKCLT